MALTNEDLQAIALLMDEKLRPINKRLNDIENKLDTMEVKQDILLRKVDDINFHVTSIEYTTKKGFTKLNDETETLIAVLESKDILPKQA